MLSYTAEHAGCFLRDPADNGHERPVRFSGYCCIHADPFDRQIIAQALAENIPAITSDEKFGLYTGIGVIW